MIKNNPTAYLPKKKENFSKQENNDLIYFTKFIFQIHLIL